MQDDVDRHRVNAQSKPCVYAGFTVYKVLLADCTVR